VKPLTGAPELKYDDGYLNAMLADFWSSKTKNSSTRFSHQTLNIGTRKWMAPEVFEIAKNEIDSAAVQLPLIAHPFKADMYSFALVCYEMLTWEQPFEGEKMGDLFKRITVDRLRPEHPDECPSRGFLDTKVLGTRSSRKAELAQNLQRTQIHQRSSPQRLNTPFLENLSCCQVANQVMQNMLT
jgi:serine/threonine protein kinase